MPTEFCKKNIYIILLLQHCLEASNTCCCSTIYLRIEWLSSNTSQLLNYFCTCLPGNSIYKSERSNHSILR